MKCNQCRKADVLDTRWDKIRLYFFRFFHNDIRDLSQDKFTQGFSDGYAVGRKHQKDENKELIELLSEPTEKAKQFPLVIDLEKVLTSNKQGHLFLNAELIEGRKLDDLKMEVTMFKNSLLWEILTNTLDHQAQEIGWTNSKELQDLMNAKMVTFTVGVQKNIIKKIENAK